MMIEIYRSKNLLDWHDNQDLHGLARVNKEMSLLVRKFCHDQATGYFFERALPLKGYPKYYRELKFERSFQLAIRNEKGDVGSFLLSLAAIAARVFQQYFIARGEYDPNELPLGVGECTPRELADIFAHFVADAEALSGEQRSWMIEDVITLNLSKSQELLWIVSVSGEATEAARGKAVIFALKNKEVDFAEKLLRLMGQISSDKVKYAIATHLVAIKDPKAVTRMLATLYMYQGIVAINAIQQAATNARAKKAYALLTLLRSTFPSVLA